MSNSDKREILTKFKKFLSPAFSKAALIMLMVGILVTLTFFYFYTSVEEEPVKVSKIGNCQTEYDCVREFQTILYSHGINVKVDGIIGTETTTMYKKYGKVVDPYGIVLNYIIKHNQSQNSKKSAGSGDMYAALRDECPKEKDSFSIKSISLSDAGVKCKRAKIGLDELKAVVDRGKNMYAKDSTYFKTEGMRVRSHMEIGTTN